MTEEIKNKIHDLAVQQITTDFEEIKKQAKGETIYGFGLGLVEDITGFFSAGNTIEALKRSFTQQEEDDFDASDFWYISEWQYSGVDNNTLYDYLATCIYEIEEENYQNHLKDYENTLIKALQTCDSKEIFGTGTERENIIIYLHYADAYNEDIDDISSEQINSKTNHLLFKERWNEEKNNLSKVIFKKIKQI